MSSSKAKRKFNYKVKNVVKNKRIFITQDNPSLGILATSHFLIGDPHLINGHLQKKKTQGEKKNTRNIFMLIAIKTG